MKPEVISPTKQRFNGVTYYKSGKYYANKWASHLRLHQAVWQAHHGDIPDGSHIHHLDHNTDNNCIENLECLSPQEHLARHTHDRGIPAAALEAAADWHRSEEGRAKHREAMLGVKFEKKPFTCIECGGAYLAAHSRSGCCGQNCRKRRARRLASK